MGVTWSRDISDQVAGELHLQAERTGASGTAVPQPRIGLYRPWRPSMDEGWTRWLLEQYDFEFTNLRNGDFHSGPLGDRFDVILFADEAGEDDSSGLPARIGSASICRRHRRPGRARVAPVRTGGGNIGLLEPEQCLRNPGAEPTGPECGRRISTGRIFTWAGRCWKWPSIPSIR